MSETKSTKLRLQVTSAAETQVRAGHPWVFASSVREQNREGRAGELAVIYDRRDAFLAIGLFDPASPIRVRILHAGRPRAIDGDWWSARLTAAMERRRGWFDRRTTGYRIINGESDGWPGLVLDRYDATLVLKLYTGAWLPRLRDVVELIRLQLQPERLVLRLSRKLQSAASSDRASQDWRDGETILGSPPAGAVVFLETGLRFEADVAVGQKTGFFFDQRENRRTIESLARGRKVLNAFSFSGGFSVYAARGGATAVTDLDLSAPALAGAKRNFALNGADAPVARCHHERVQADAFEWLKANERRRFDLIILDPPSFAKQESERAGAIRAYEKLASLGISRLSGGGVLLACSCSAHVSAEEFFEAVRAAARRTGGGFEEIRTAGHAPDHPATFKEAEYLKGIYLKMKGTSNAE